MTQKISKGLYAFITLTILLVGAFFVAKAMEEKRFSKAADEYHWFEITDDYSPEAKVSPTKAIYLGYGATPPATKPNCQNGSTHQCVSGFSPNQVIMTGSNYVLSGDQAPNQSAPNELRN